MPYKGHVENGAIVLDEPAKLAEGVTVYIEVIDSTNSGEKGNMPLRGTLYSYDEPFAPAADAGEWDAVE